MQTRISGFTFVHNLAKFELLVGEKYGITCSEITINAKILKEMIKITFFKTL
jgi:hypothetical protein